MRIVFAGSPAAAVPSLQGIAQSRHEILAVVTREDSPQGRRAVLTPTPVARTAEDYSIDVIRANRLSGEPTEHIRALAPDLGVIVAYGGLIREPLLSTPRLGWINLHFSLLPRWRGAAPVQHAIIAGDETTGVSVFRLVEELDAGDLLATVTEPIGRHETAGNLLSRLAEVGARLLVATVDALDAGTAQARPQVGDVTVAPKLTVADGRLDFGRSARVVHDRIRGVTPEPGAHTTVDGVRLKVWEATIAHGQAPLEPGRFDVRGGAVLVGTATEPMELLRVQPAGRTAMDAAAWWRGRPGDAETVAE
jgi:methionyl-tRNA formyltransferase